MNWDALQAIAELTAAVGVVISLVYLAAQVRQNTNSIRGAASQDLLMGYNAILDFSKGSTFGAQTYSAVFRGVDLSPEEQVVQRVATIQMWRLHEQAYLQYQAGNLSEEVWEGWEYQIRMSTGIPGMLMGWPAVRPMLSQEFVKWVDGFEEDSPRIASEYVERWDQARADILKSDREE